MRTLNTPQPSSEAERARLQDFKDSLSRNMREEQDDSDMQNVWRFVALIAVSWAVVNLIKLWQALGGREGLVSIITGHLS